MGRKPTGKPNGRPPVPVIGPSDPNKPPVEWKGKLPEKFVNIDQVIYWIELQATAQEIASSFRISTETLDKKLKESTGMGFLELKERCDGTKKITLRRYQFQQAETNPNIARWLGQIWLKQQEPPKNISEEIGDELLNEIFDNSRDPMLQDTQPLADSKQEPNL